MRILVLNDDYPPEGQSSAGGVAAALAQGYRGKGHSVSIITTHRIEKDRAIRRDGDLWSIPVSYRAALRHYRCLYMPCVSRMLDTIIAGIRPDAVHAHNVHTYLTYDALRIARRHTPQVFLTLHDVMSFSYARLATARYLASEGRDTRTTMLDHLRQAGLQWNPVRNAWIRRIIKKNVCGCVAVSESLARAVRAHGLPVHQVIHHGIDLSAWHTTPDAVMAFRAHHGLQHRKVLLFGGRLSIDKGVVPLLRALEKIRRQLPAVTLLVAGERERFEGMLEVAGVPRDLTEHILMTGWLPPDQMRLAYAVADVVTTPSLCLDTFNLMNLEAMAAGKPVIGTIFGGTPEIVVDGVTGCVRNPLDLPSYTDALLALLRDDALAERMGQAGRSRAAEYFILEKQMGKYLALFQENLCS